VQIIRRALLAGVLLPSVTFAQQSTKSSPPDLNVYSRPAIPENMAGNQGARGAAPFAGWGVPRSKWSTPS
jgi:hypothetical protein